ncbi:conserved hypothetical protein [Bathymodiolus platifrons methanotrophic gill symbiont]|uniref:pentapeptide repeat-containing protein n=1 Tax=Bathymodiolus platifrons methanotrophic gill symbiont TaxID=113268 RepID=UPI000B4141F0|nr:pentapeptide repeat-containing protein [Bathymodiolus platifrons methanotrophic gill symbiont]GAW86779.1 conserved hypothetical protein [Bathymodiolus platifrons methanotrophic gill symbiont]GFO76383.1 hypothetical protein BPLS_P4122 [Bathymodiolus platifrons methanotrophic gill symbiont]
MNTNYKDRKTISGKDKEAFDEFLAGKERWNAYVDKHNDNTEVDFSKVDFSKHRKGNGEFNFSEYRFPKNGSVSFASANFGEGAVSFKDSTFYGNGVVNFEDAKFGKGLVLFECTGFGKGRVTFERAQFGKGGVYFNGSAFMGVVTFRHSRLGEGVFICDYCEFGGHVSFESLKFSERLSKFSLRHSSFDKSFDISDNTFNCIPDLTNTKLTNQVSLDRMEISDNYPPKGDFDKSDGERLCRLKELAEANKSYQQALGFHVIEMRAKQDKIKNQNTKDKKLRIYLGEIFHRYLDKIFDVVCIYGQSIIRPVLWLLGLTIVCTLIYANESSLDYFPLGYGFLYSVSQVFSFVPAGRSITIGILDKLFPCEPQQIPNVIYSLSLIQGVLSFLLVFLIGLGLRNRFRL